MIKYNSGSFGFSVLLRIHGSAVYKSLLPSLISSVIFIALFETVELQSENQSKLFVHPYPMGALISALTFLLAFRANFAYNRYWEGIGSVHQMHSKWLDVGMELAAFHLQAAVYDSRKPPAFGAHPELNDLERARERNHELTLEELESQLETMEQHDEMEEVMGSSTPKRSSLFRRRRKKQEASPEPPTKMEDKQNFQNKVAKSKQSLAFPPASAHRKPPIRATITKSINAVSLPPIPSQHKSSKRSSIQQFANWITSKPSPVEEEILLENAVVQAAAHCRVKAWDHDKPPLFLQEAAHLLSLLSAVAFSTLRNDLEQADSPLIPFTANAPWPHVDPDSYEADVRKDWATSNYTITVLRYIFGWSRTPTARTLYNAARPFRVIGGVSDAEIELLQAARGPFAKVALCTLWLQEFIIRESLEGATGKVAPPILSRLFQFVSDGMIGYNQARKVAYIPFPVSFRRKRNRWSNTYHVIETNINIPCLLLPVSSRSDHESICVGRCRIHASSTAELRDERNFWFCIELPLCHELYGSARGCSRT